MSIAYEHTSIYISLHSVVLIMASIIAYGPHYCLGPLTSHWVCRISKYNGTS